MQSNKHIRILMVEDCESDASLNLRALEKAGFEVQYEMVSTESEMRSALNRGQFDLVLSDHNLPQFDSAGALRVFKASGLDVPFIVVSGGIGEATVRVSADATDQRHVELDQIRASLRHRRSRTQSRRLACASPAHALGRHRGRSRSRTGQ